MTGAALVQTLFEQRSIPRGDELLTHFSDAHNCLRATAYRRRGLPSAPYAPRDLAKFAIGHAYEMEVANTLRAAGHEVEYDPENFVVSGWGLEIGHPDMLVDNSIVVECKTTDAFSPFEPATIARKPNPRAGELKPLSPSHTIQVSMSALAIAEIRMLPPLRAVVLTKYAGVGEQGHIEYGFDVEPEQHREHIEQLAHDVIRLTGPEMPLPPATPPGSTVLSYNACVYCRFHQCEANPKYEEFPL